MNLQSGGYEHTRLCKARVGGEAHQGTGSPSRKLIRRGACLTSWARREQRLAGASYQNSHFVLPSPEGLTFSS